jgi:hypothetical protein
MPPATWTYFAGVVRQRPAQIGVVALGVPDVVDLLGQLREPGLVAARRGVRREEQGLALARRRGVPGGVGRVNGRAGRDIGGDQQRRDPDRRAQAPRAGASVGLVEPLVGEGSPVQRAPAPGRVGAPEAGRVARQPEGERVVTHQPAERPQRREDEQLHQAQHDQIEDASGRALDRAGRAVERLGDARAQQRGHGGNPDDGPQHDCTERVGEPPQDGADHRGDRGAHGHAGARRPAPAHVAGDRRPVRRPLVRSLRRSVFVGLRGHGLQNSG